MDRAANEFNGTHRFEVVGRLGEGATGIVYEVFDRELEETVALKVLRVLNADTVLHLKNEFRALQDLQHPNLVSYGELFEDDGRWFFTMELINGVSFIEYVRKTTIGLLAAADDVMADTALNLPTPQEAAALASADPASSRNDNIVVPLRVSFDETKLRDVFSQLAKGLAAFHASGQVHRDVKPSNFMVTKEGRGVLLDFGLVTDVVKTDEHVEQRVVGTVAYMAPEQGASKAVGPEADCYSAGVLLYEVLTGRLPFSGRSHQILMDKQRTEPRSPSDFVSELPEDLIRLCRELLRFDPIRRPTALDISQRLGGPEGPHAGIKSPSFSTSQAPIFIGRDTELAAIEDAYQRAACGMAVTFLISGESGIGKTALVRRFTSRMSAEAPAPVILSGRCYERESVPYKAIDGVVDALGRYFGSLDSETARNLVPISVAWVAQVFPVLRRLDAVSSAPQLPKIIDPQERRGRMFAAMREIFTRICSRRPVVMVIDDIQWADADSLALLVDLLRPPDAPPLLFIATRQKVETKGSAKLEIEAVARLTFDLHSELEHLYLEPFDDQQAHMLAEQLLQRGGRSPVTAAEIVAETGGHPLFIDELVRHNLTIDNPEQATTRLDVAIRARIDSLESSARRVLQVVCLSLAPLTQEVVAVAAAIPKGTFARKVAMLRVAHLIRTGGTRGVDTVEPYHSRIRDAVVDGLSKDERVYCHRRLALALESAWKVDAEAVAVHLAEAGDFARASEMSETAGDQALASLAFGRAVALFSAALELGIRTASRTGNASLVRHRELRIKLGHAMAAAGHSGGAAKCYLRAAEGATTADSLELRRLASEQLLRSGRIRAGLGTLETVLKGVGISMPRTPKRALFDLALRRAHLRLRGTSFKEVDESQVAAHELMRVDVCWAATSVMGMVDNLRGACFQARHLLLALKAGEPRRIARAYVSEAAFLAASSRKGQVRANVLLERARDIGRRIDNAYVIALADGVDGIANFLNAQWRSGAALCENAETRLREKCTGVAYEVHTTNMFRLSNLFFLGEISQLSELVPYYKSEAVDRGDRYAGTNLSQGILGMWRLAHDQPEELREESSGAMASWSDDEFFTQHFWDFVSQCNAHLYQGNGDAAWRIVAGTWPRLRYAMLLQMQFFRIIALDIRGRAALARVATDGSMLGEAKKVAKKLAGEKANWASAKAALLRVGIARHEGNDEAVVEHFRSAIAMFDDSEMALHRWASARGMGHVLGGDEGSELTKTADLWMEGQGILRPERMAACFAPGVYDD